MARKKGKTVTIFSTKGGVGKTFFTLNLAGIYSLIGKKVLIVDLDLYSGGIALSLNIDQTKDIYNLVDDLNNNRYTEFKDYVLKYNDNIDVLPCPKDPRLGSKIEAKYVEIVMINAISKYDIVLIDTSHILNDVNLVALDKTDEILMILSNDPIDLKNMKSIISIFKDTEINNYKIILNQSINKHKDVFTVFDIKNIINDNINWTISNAFHVRDVDKWTLKGKIPFLDKKMQRLKKKDFDRYNKIAQSLLTEEKGGPKDE